MKITFSAFSAEVKQGSPRQVRSEGAPGAEEVRGRQGLDRQDPRLRPRAVQHHGQAAVGHATAAQGGQGAGGGRHQGKGGREGRRGRVQTAGKHAWKGKAWYIC